MYCLVLCWVCAAIFAVVARLLLTGHLLYSYQRWPAALAS